MTHELKKGGDPTSQFQRGGLLLEVNLNHIKLFFTGFNKNTSFL